MNGWTDGQMDRQKNRQADRWTDGCQMEGWTNIPLGLVIKNLQTEMDGQMTDRQMVG